MANLSLREVNQSQLESAPIVDGQLIVCKDTGNMYRDFGMTRVQTGRDIEIVAELPLAPINGKVYCLLPDELYVYNGDWIKLNDPTSVSQLKEEIDKQQEQIDAILREDLRKEGFVGHCYNGFTHCQPT